MSSIRDAMALVAHHFAEGGWGMYPVLACLVVLCGLTIERALFLHWPRPRTDALREEIRDALRTGDVSAAIGHAGVNAGAAARITRAALRHAIEPIDRIEAAIAMQLERELAALRAHLRGFGAVAGIATLLGLLGSVTALDVGFGHCNADAVSRATLLARGISESLNCTALGLFVALLACIASTLLHARSEELADDLRACAKAVRNALVDRRADLRWNGQRAAIERATYRASH